MKIHPVEVKSVNSVNRTCDMPWLYIKFEQRHDGAGWPEPSTESVVIKVVKFVQRVVKETRGHGFRAKRVADWERARCMLVRKFSLI